MVFATDGIQLEVYSCALGERNVAALDHWTAKPFTIHLALLQLVFNDIINCNLKISALDKPNITLHCRELVRTWERRMWYLMVFNGIWFRCCRFYKRVFSTEIIKYSIAIVVEKKKDLSQMVEK